MTVKSYDPETGKELTGDIDKEFFRGEQKWQAVTVDGARWAVPSGWPNNATPICEESEPAAYAEIVG